MTLRPWSPSLKCAEVFRDQEVNLVLRRAEVLARVASAVLIGVAVTVPPRSLRTAHADVATSARSAVPRVSKRHLVELFQTPSGRGILLSARQQAFLTSVRHTSASDRIRVARPRADLRLADTIKLNLYDDVEFVAVRQALDLYGSSMLVWSGTLLGDSGYVLLGLHAESLHGIVQASTGTFRITPLGEGICAIRRVVTSTPGSGVCGVRDSDTATNEPSAPAPPTNPASFPARLDAEPVVANIDVLVAYEESAAELTPDIVGHIQFLIEWTNFSYRNSRIHLATPGPCWPGVQCVMPKLLLAATLPLECDGCISDVMGNDAILESFATPDDGRFDEIHEVRDAVDADVCVLLTTLDRPNSNGIAMAGPPDPETAFCLVETPWSLEHPYILGHEVGHLQGAQHHTGLSTARPYARGWCYNPTEQPEDRFWTIMCTLSSNRIPFWSNPEILYEAPSGNLIPMGDPDHNNSRRLNETALIVASHRGLVVVPIEVADFEATTSSAGVRLDWRLSESARRQLAGVHVQRARHAAGPYRDQTLAPLQPEAAMSWVDTGVIGGESYWYRLRLLSAAGAEEIGSPVQAVVERWRTRLHAPIFADGHVSVRYSIGTSVESIHLGLFDVRGRLVTTLDGGAREPGEYRLEWNRKTAAGEAIGSGVYLLRLKAGRESATVKLVLRN
ncbi:MAG: hypothetical protein JSW67_02865 [Candidatus Latescibacterota bacterium]|nr:MAG: hypothetical protein JSW67_02865 [Candidatus Latescibacterota bacterium]